MRAHRVVVLCVLVALPLVMGGADRRRNDDTALFGLGPRLAALRGDDPVAYFELGEEVAYELASPEGQALARRLFVLAYALSERDRDEHPWLARSVCLALSELATEAEERRWLRALAATLERRREHPGWTVERAGRGADNSLLEVATLLGDARRYENRRVRVGLRRHDIEEMLQEGGVSRDEAVAIVAELVIASNEPPVCPVCKNDRITRERSGADLDVLLCRRCRGNPGAEMNAEHFVSHIRAEGVLLGAEPDTWAGQLALNRARPLRDVDPSELASHFDIDVLRVVWVASGNGAEGGVPTGEWERP